MSVMTRLFGTIGEGVNTADCGSVMQGFESLIVPHFEISSLPLFCNGKLFFDF